MKINPNFILKEVADTYVVVPTGSSAVDFNGMLTLNKSAKLLFEALYEEKNEDNLIQILLDTYDVSRDEAKTDVSSFVALLQSKNIIL